MLVFLYLRMTTTKRASLGLVVSADHQAEKPSLRGRSMKRMKTKDLRTSKSQRVRMEARCSIRNQQASKGCQEMTPRVTYTLNRTRAIVNALKALTRIRSAVRTRFSQEIWTLKIR